MTALPMPNAAFDPARTVPVGEDEVLLRFALADDLRDAGFKVTEAPLLATRDRQADKRRREWTLVTLGPKAI
jgi:hypothetical protein